MKKTEFRFNLAGLEGLQKEIGAAKARVGIIGSMASQNHQLREGAGKKFLVNRAQSESITNAELLMIMMFGSLTRSIPPRDPLLKPIMDNKEKLMRMLQTGKMRSAFERQDYIGMLKLLGIAGEVIVQEAFETSGNGEWEANANSTIRQKNSSMPLINTSQLRRAFSSDVVRGNTIPNQQNAGG